MSKRLTDEALAYFDECVSLSTFDSSDFSSPEDPPFNLVGITTPVDKSLSLLQESSSASAVKSPNGSLNEKQVHPIPWCLLFFFFFPKCFLSLNLYGCEWEEMNLACGH